MSVLRSAPLTNLTKDPTPVVPRPNCLWLLGAHERLLITPGYARLRIAAHLHEREAARFPGCGAGLTK